MAIARRRRTELERDIGRLRDIEHEHVECRKEILIKLKAITELQGEMDIVSQDYFRLYKESIYDLDSVSSKESSDEESTDCYVDENIDCGEWERTSEGELDGTMGSEDWMESLADNFSELCTIDTERSRRSSTDSNDSDYYDRMVELGVQMAERQEQQELKEQRRLKRQHQKLQADVNELVHQIRALHGRIEEGDIRKKKEALDIIGRYFEEMAGNEMHLEYGRSLPRVWEYFATALLQGYPRLFGVEGPVTAEHSGGANDWGVDVHVYTQEPRRLIAVVQAKRGNFFSTGKGNSIVLSLIGSCVCFGTTRGIIFSNEHSADLTRQTRDLISTLGKKGYTVRCLFKNDIKKMVEKLRAKHVAAVLERLLTLLNTN